LAKFDKPLQNINKSLGAFSTVPVKDFFADTQFYLKGHLAQIFSSFIFAWCLSALAAATIAGVLGSSRLH